MSLKRIILGGSVSTLGAVCYSAYTNRPIYPVQVNVEIDVVKSHQLNEKTASTVVVTKEVDEQFLRTGLYSPRTSEESWLLKLARAAAISEVTVWSRLVLEVFNDFKVVGDEKKYKNLMSLVHQGKQRQRGLITVSNHTSVFDDPVLQACIVKFLPPDLMRWGVCKESICFRNALAASFTGAGKVLPVKVGDGVEQIAFKAVGRRLAEGEWIHIYPEAACIQSGSIGRGQLFGCRSEEKAKTIGLFKWGVGKLAARTAFQENNLPPIIIPYYHTGMDKVKPQVNLPDSNQLIDPWYIPARTGHKIRVFVGPPIEIDDLINMYEEKIKRKRRIAWISNNNEFVDWDGSTKEEYQLYSDITRRVETALLKLENEARDYHQLQAVQLQPPK